MLDTVAALEINNIERSVENIDRSVFADVADAVFVAEHTYTFGMGVSAHLADLAAYTLTQAGVRATALSTRFTSPREQAVSLRDTDLLIVFSFPPYSKQSIQLVRDASDRGSSTVAICDRLTAPAAAAARWALSVKSDNTMFTNAVAAITVVFNALAAEIAASHRERALEAFAHINRVLDEDADVIQSER